MMPNTHFTNMSIVEKSFIQLRAGGGAEAKNKICSRFPNNFKFLCYARDD